MIKIIERYKSKLSTPNENPIESAKKIISGIQKFVGIRDVFGDRELGWSPLSVLATVLFPGSFLYTGEFSQLMYLVSVFLDKVDTFKAINCIRITATSVTSTTLYHPAISATISKLGYLPLKQITP